MITRQTERTEWTRYADSAQPPAVLDLLARSKAEVIALLGLCPDGGLSTVIGNVAVHRIIITPTLNWEGRHRRSSKGPLFDASCEGEVIVVGSTEPCLDSARALKARGLTGRLEMWGTVLPYHLFHADIEKAAGLTIEEGERQPRLRRYVSRGGGMAKYDDFASGGIPVAQTGESRPTDSPRTPTGEVLAGQQV